MNFDKSRLIGKLSLQGYTGVTKTFPRNSPAISEFPGIILGPNGMGTSLIAGKFWEKVFVTHPSIHGCAL